jgi:glycosyltransferase involved in cell wall biosynthesis
LPIKFSIFKETFSSPQMILFNTNEEKDFVHNRFNNSYIDWDVVGIGIDTPNNLNIISKKSDNFLNNYVVYVGRIDIEKGCQELFSFFIRFKTQYPSDLKLLLIGKTVMPIPTHSDILYLGFVDEVTKYRYIANATLLIMPSPYESLSMVLLESWYCKRPVLVNGQCEVLKGQCIRSGGGFWYNNYEGFSSYLHQIIMDENQCISMGIKGHEYVVENYSWDNIIKKYLNAIDICISKKKSPISNCNIVKGL